MLCTHAHSRHRPSGGYLTSHPATAAAAVAVGRGLPGRWRGQRGGASVSLAALTSPSCPPAGQRAGPGFRLVSTRVWFPLLRGEA